MTPNTQVLEIRAAEQRRRLRSSVEELKGKLQRKLDVKTNAREYLIPASAALAVTGLAMGYVLASIGFHMAEKRPQLEEDIRNHFL